MAINMKLAHEAIEERAEENGFTLSKEHGGWTLVLTRSDDETHCFSSFDVRGIESYLSGYEYANKELTN